MPPSPPPPRRCTVPQAGERTDQRQTVRPRGPQGVEGVARSPQVGGTRGCTPGRPPPSAGMQRQGEGAGYPHPLIRPSRPTSARLGLGGGGGGKLGHRSLPQAPACEANAGRDPTALEAEREAGASDPADSAGTATCPPAGPRLPDASSPDQRGGLPGGTSRGQSHGHSAHKGPLAERLGQSGIRPWSLARPAEAPTSVRTKGLVQDSSRLSREKARFQGQGHSCVGTAARGTTCSQGRMEPPLILISNRLGAGRPQPPGTRPLQASPLELLPTEHTREGAKGGTQGAAPLGVPRASPRTLLPTRTKPCHQPRSETVPGAPERARANPGSQMSAHDSRAVCSMHKLCPL